MAVSGWDLRPGNLGDTVRRQKDLPKFNDITMAQLDAVEPRPGVMTNLDVQSEANICRIETASADETLKILETDILRHRESSGARQSIVIYLGSPHATRPASKDGSRSLLPTTWADALTRYVDLPSSLLYGLAATRTGSHFVDFTPGVALEAPLLHASAEEAGTQLAGRDGSTGQTYLKHWIAEALHIRGIDIAAWYSTNVIGNHDGYVLSMPDHSVVKMSDKRDGLSAILGHEVSDHYINIDYVPTWGDRKESWDAVLAKGWFDSAIDLRINWRGTDSLLASVLLFDIVRLLEYGGRLGRKGLRSELGIFFKRPLGREGVPPSHLYDELITSFTG
jgi:myo-inositol-1-phosphate synthase